MARTVHVTPGRLTVLQARIGIVVAALFLVFGLAFAAVVLGEMPESEGGLRILVGLFFVIFVGVCIAMVVTFARVSSAKASPRDRSIVDVELGAPGAEPPVQEKDFETRLRRLEALKRDGMISEAEYRDKRAQIVGERW